MNLNSFNIIVLHRCFSKYLWIIHFGNSKSQTRISHFKDTRLNINPTDFPTLNAFSNHFYFFLPYRWAASPASYPTSATSSSEPMNHGHLLGPHSLPLSSPVPKGGAHSKSRSTALCLSKSQMSVSISLAVVTDNQGQWIHPRVPTPYSATMNLRAWRKLRAQLVQQMRRPRSRETKCLASGHWAKVWRRRSDPCFLQ